MSVSSGGISFNLHGQCYFSFPIKILNKSEIELIWSPNADCVFSPGLWEDYGVSKPPEEGKPFAKYTFKNNQLKVDYYYPDWVKKYNYSEVFGETTYDFNYHYFNGNSGF